MGVIAKQSFQNLIYTYLGFAIGAINTLFLYTNFMTDEYYGLVGYLISVANVMMPVFNFGVQNSLIRFYSAYKDKEQLNRFVTMMLFLPLVSIIPIGVLGWLTYDFIGGLLSQKNAIVKDYVWLIFVIAAAMAYFEVFYAYTKVQMKSVLGNFMKEVFHRVVIMLLLFALHYQYLTIAQFIYSVAAMYVLRTIVMLFVAHRMHAPTFSFKLPFDYVNVLKYSTLIILAGSIAIVLLDIDKVMLGQYIEIQNVAYYNVAVFIALVIVVPSRAMQQISTSVVAKLMNEKNYADLNTLYHQSSINLLIICSIIAVLIMVNLNQMYLLIPENYSNGTLVVLFIALAKISDSVIGVNNAIIFNSPYYRMVLFFGVLLAILAVVFNAIFIPIWGINGSAFATLLSFLIYNGIKLFFVYKKYRMQPLSNKTLVVTVFMACLGIVFYYWNFSIIHPIVTIMIKSAIIVLVSVFVIIRFKISEELNLVWIKYSSYLKKENRRR